MIKIIKRRGHKEKFDERKVYASCYEACLNTQLPKLEAEKICDKVTKEIKKWVKIKKEVTSEDIFKQMTKIIRKFNKHAAFMYETHRDIS